MTRMFGSLLAALFLLSLLTVLFGCTMEKGSSRAPKIPPEYQGKHMPAGWWSDEAIVEEGRALYLGLRNRDVNCAECHGRNGKPVKSGARDFRDTDSMKRYSDSHLLWRVAEGVPFTRMAGYKDELSEREMWKIIAFVRTFGLEGMRYDVADKQWVPIDEKGPVETGTSAQGRAQAPGPVALESRAADPDSSVIEVRS